MLPPQAPKANFDALPNVVLVGDTISFNPGASVPGNGGAIVRYQWDFRYDGTQMRNVGDPDAVATIGPQVIPFVYAFPGAYTVALRVWNDENASDLVTHKVFVTDQAAVTTNPTALDFDDPAPGSFEVGEVVTKDLYINNSSGSQVRVISISGDISETQVPATPINSADWTVAPGESLNVLVGLRNFNTDRVDGSITVHTDRASDPDIVIPIGGTARSGFARVGDMLTPRKFHTATRLPDGTVLIVGGEDAGNQDLDSVEIYDPDTHTFLPGPPLAGPRSHHTATGLGNGDVLVAGGIGPSGVLQTGTVYHYQTDQWDAEFPLFEPRAQHVAVRVVPAGNTERVVLIGGRGDLATNDGLDTAEILLSNGAYVGTAILTEPRLNHAAVALDDHRILIAGGNGLDDGASGTSEVLNVSSAVSAIDDDLNVSRYELTLTRVAAPSVAGGVSWLVVGGGQISIGARRTVEAYTDAVGGGFTLRSAQLAQPRRRHVAVDLGGGMGLLVLGGVGPTNLAVGQAELITPTGSSVTTLPDSMNVARSQGHKATLLDDGSVLITGGVATGGAGSTRAAELYVP